MTLYLDTSALIEVYLKEPEESLVREALDANALAWTSEISYLELRSGFARAVREARLDEAHHQIVSAQLESDWPNYAGVRIDLPLLRQAADLADHHRAHSLRALDALQLAAALRACNGSRSAMTFACWDRRLWRSARDEGFACLSSEEP